MKETLPTIAGYEEGGTEPQTKDGLWFTRS